jgi:hypothetical protein
MSPTIQTQGHIDTVLSNISLGFSQQGGFVADQIFPIVSVRKESDLYYLFGRERFRSVNSKRQRGAQANEVIFGYTTDSYTCEENSLQGFVDDRDYQNFDAPIDPEITTVEQITDLLQLGYEKEVATTCCATATYPDSNHYGGPTAQYDSGGASITVQVDFQKKMNVIRGKVGLWPNTIVIPPTVAFYLSMTTEIQNIVKYTIASAGVNDLAMLVRGPKNSWLLPAVLWDMNVLVPLALEDTSRPSQTLAATATLTTSLTDVWGDSIWMGYVQPRPTIKSVSFGYTFESRGYETKRWRAEERESNGFRVSRVCGRKVVCSAAGALLTDCLSTV